MNSTAGLEALKEYFPEGSPLQQERGRAVRRLAERLLLVLVQEKELASEIRQLAKARFSPLTRLCGTDLLTAGRLAAILGPGNRFSTDAQLAAYAGTCAIA